MLTQELGQNQRDEFEGHPARSAVDCMPLQLGPFRSRKSNRASSYPTITRSLDIGDDAVLAAEIEHLLGFGNALGSAVCVCLAISRYTARDATHLDTSRRVDARERAS